MVDGGVASSALIRSILSGCLRQAVKWEMIRRNPLAAVEPPRADCGFFIPIRNPQSAIERS
jgi:hypothetical protein